MKSFNEYLTESIPQENLRTKDIYFDFDIRVHRFDLNGDVLNALSQNEIVGLMEWKGAREAMYLGELNSYDRKYASHIKLKNGEMLFRYSTRTAAISGLAMYVKVNVLKKLVYLLTEESTSGTDDPIQFETRGIKLEFIRLAPEYMRKFNVW